MLEELDSSGGPNYWPIGWWGAWSGTPFLIGPDGAVFGPSGWGPHDPSPSSPATDPGALAQGSWHHLAGVLDPQCGPGVRLYLDGQEVGYWGEATKCPSSSIATTLGAINYLGWNTFFRGRIDEVRISSVARYSRPFTPVARHEVDESTWGLWHFDEGVGSVAVDEVAGRDFSLFGNFEWTDGVPVDPDCDGDSIPNSEEIAQGAPDCNGNGIPDECDVASGFSLDQDSNGVPDECSPPLLAASPTELDALAGGTQTFTLTAGPDSKLDLYLLLGSISGTSPGFPLGDLTLPLNIVDPYFDFTLEQPNSAALVNTLGVLDIQGTATASVNVPTSAQYPSLIGLTFHHAYVVLGDDLGVSLVSNPVELKLLP